jgi:ABC-2 type transport system permease protein
VNGRAIRAVVRRDLVVVMGSRSVVLPALIVPAVLLIVLPALAGLAPVFLGSVSAADMFRVLEALPPEAGARLSGDPSTQAAELAVTYLLAPMILIVPVMFATVIAADALAGEKERGTLEGLLLTPLSDRELVVAKLIASWVPAVVLGLAGAIVYAGVANLVVMPQTNTLVLPTPEYAVMALWVGPTFAAAALGAIVLVSVRSNSTQEAFQLGGVVVLPVVIIVITQATGVVLLSVPLLLASGLIALGLAAVLLLIGSRVLSRTRMGEKLG